MRWNTGAHGRAAAQACIVTETLELLDVRHAPLFARVERFQSKREAKRFLVLKILERAGQISHLRRQVRYHLRCPVPGAIVPPSVTTYTSDFEYVLCCDGLWGAIGEHIVEDCKGFRERMYLLKKKWLYLQEGIVIYET